MHCLWVAAAPALAAMRLNGDIMDHTSEYLRDYQVRVNASPSDVVSTMNTEAPATVKYVAALLYLSHESWRSSGTACSTKSPSSFRSAMKRGKCVRSQAEEGRVGIFRIEFRVL